VISTDRRKDDRWVVLPITSYPAQVISMKNIVSIFKETTSLYSENNRKRNSVCAWDKLGSVSLLAVVLMLPYQDAFDTASYFSMEQCTKSGISMDITNIWEDTAELSSRRFNHSCSPTSLRTRMEDRFLQQIIPRWIKMVSITPQGSSNAGENKFKSIRVKPYMG
jgi:hypothetical protein